MKGLRIGHFTQQEQATGASVFIFDKPAVGAYFLCGSSPASHELHVLEPEANVSSVDGLAFLGGSAFGLPAVMGMMRWFKENNRGWATPHGFVPIVPAAAIYDLAIKTDLPPTEHDVYVACQNATENNRDTGRVGAGCGASVGKLIADAKRMSGGLGFAEMMMPEGVTVLAYAIVNPVGDVCDAQGRIIAGARYPNGTFAETEKKILAGMPEGKKNASNTTLVALFTDAKFSKAELKRISKMAAAGIARAITPAFTRYDGDLIFSFSLGDKLASELMVGTVAAYLIQAAIENAVKDSIILE